MKMAGIHIRMVLMIILITAFSVQFHIIIHPIEAERIILGQGGLDNQSKIKY